MIISKASQVDFEKIYKLLYNFDNNKISKKDWRMTFSSEVLGIKLETDDEEIVGFLGWIEKDIDGKIYRNLTSWFIKEEYRSYALEVLKNAINDNCVYTDLTPTENASKLLKAFKFNATEDTVLLYVNTWKLRKIDKQIYCNFNEFEGLGFVEISGHKIHYAINTICVSEVGLSLFERLIFLKEKDSSQEQVRSIHILSCLKQINLSPVKMVGLMNILTRNHSCSFVHIDSRLVPTPNLKLFRKFKLQNKRLGKNTSDMGDNYQTELHFLKLNGHQNLRSDKYARLVKDKEEKYQELSINDKRIKDLDLEIKTLEKILNVKMELWNGSR